MIDIRVPGSKDNVCRKATQRDINRFPRHYEAFKARISDEYLEGMPLKEWPLITRSQVEELAFINVKTVEQLSAVSDANASQIMGIYKLKEKAKEWLEAFNESEKIRKEAAMREEELAALREEIDQLKESLKAATASKPRTARKKKTAKKKE